MFRTLSMWLFFLVLVAGGAGGGYYYYKDLREAPVEYRTEAMSQGDVTKKVSATGSVRSVTNTSVGCEVSGRIVKLYVDFNSKVKKGDLMALIDPSSFVSQVEQQKATLADNQAGYQNALANLLNAKSGVPKAKGAVFSAEAQVDAAKATVANSKAMVITAQANVKKARASLDNNASAYQRQQILLARNLVAYSDVDTAKSAYLQDKANLDSMIASAEAADASYRSNIATLQARQADYESAKASYDGAVAQEQVAVAMVDSAAAKVRLAKETLNAQRLNLDRTRVTSPIDGIVVDRQATVGETVAASMSVPNLFTLAEDLERMQVEVTVDEADIGVVHKGQPVTFTVDAFPEENFAGNVSEVRLASTNTNGVITYTVVVSTKNPKLKLMPGMTATVSIKVDSREDVLLVPNSALRFKAPLQPGETRTPHEHGSGTPHGSSTPGGRKGGARRHAWTSLFTVDANNKLVRHRVRLGISDGSKTEVVRSDPKLKAADEVVVEAVGGSSSASPAAAAGGRGGGGPRMPRMF